MLKSCTRLGSITVMHEFHPISGCPGYEINALGQVRGRSGRILRHDPDGRVQLNTPRGPRRFYVGELVPVYREPAQEVDCRAALAMTEQDAAIQDDRVDLLRRIDHLERVIAEHEAVQGCFDPFGGEA
jgi:hypothetical protein